MMLSIGQSFFSKFQLKQSNYLGNCLLFFFLSFGFHMFHCYKYSQNINISKLKKLKLNSLSTRTSIITISDENSLQAVKIVSDAFPYESDHSWTRALGIPGNLSGFLISQVSKYISFPPQSIAVHQHNNPSDILGVLFLEDVCGKVAITNNDNKNEEGNSQIEKSSNVTESSTEKRDIAYAPIDALLKECEAIFSKNLFERSRISIPTQQGKCCYVAWIAVKADCRGLGLAGTLLQEASSRLKKYGYSYAFAYCSHPISTRAFVREGYEVWGQIPYKNFEFQGKFPFQSIPDEISVVVKTF